MNFSKTSASLSLHSSQSPSDAPAERLCRLNQVRAGGWLGPHSLGCKLESQASVTPLHVSATHRLLEAVKRPHRGHCWGRRSEDHFGFQALQLAEFFTPIYSAFQPSGAWKGCIQGPDRWPGRGYHHFWFQGTETPSCS